ncbi:MAG: DUF4093 domain-containing protein [Clostridia bacterium]|nr:DUF4093 domain-containing protein [Clostridia bacterium]
MNRIKLKEVVIVEGKYDKIRLESLIDAIIITTDGFGIFNDSEKRTLIRRMADERGLLILTDSDGAGFVIRNYISGWVDSSKIKHAYIPQLLGKERRKAAPSKEGTLGVEGMENEVLLSALRRAGVSTLSHGDTISEPITRMTLFEDGVIGGDNSDVLRAKLLRELGLPSMMSTNALLSVINLVTDMSEYRRLIDKLTKSDETGKMCAH